MNFDLKKFMKSIAIPLIVGGLAGFLTSGSMKEFQNLNQPPLSPPGWLFPVVWTILYTLMGISTYLISTAEAEQEEISGALSIYKLQLIVNFLWPILFFNFGWYLLALIWLLLLWLLVAQMIKKFAEISKTAAYLNIPYLIWLTFAAYLNLGVWWLNR